MSALRTLVRNAVERSPSVAAAYRAARDEWRAYRTYPRRTPRGYMLSARQDMVDGSFEPAETALVAEFLREADVFVDVGANVGYYTCLARAAGCRCVAIEPSQSNLRYLYRNLADNGWSDVEVLPVAASDSPGIARLHGGGTAASLIDNWDSSGAGYVTFVPTARLDDLLGERFAGMQLLVKVDVEGAESAALRGAAETLGRTPRPIWIVEIGLAEHRTSPNREFTSTFQEFLDRGYLAFAVADAPVALGLSDIERWSEAGTVPVGTGNYLFVDAAAVPHSWRRAFTATGGSRAS